MSEVDPTQNHSHNISQNGPKAPSYSQDDDNARKKRKAVFNPSGGRLHKFGPLYFTKEQWAKFLRQLEQTLSSEMRRQQKRIKAAQEQLKRSIKGEPL
ncbi:MAG: hypothetical protein AAGI90_03005 [Chlamydiota bacterium]